MTPERAVESVVPRFGRFPRLRPLIRKSVLVLHIASAGSWLGIDVVMGVLVFTSLVRNDTATVALCYQVLGLIAVWPLFVAGLTCLATGIVLGLGSRYGLVRYWWIAAKLVLNLMLTGLVLVALRPGLNELSRVGRELAAGNQVDAALHGMLYPPIVSPIALILALVLAVFKPWGRIRGAGESTATRTVAPAEPGGGVQRPVA